MSDLSARMGPRSSPEVVVVGGGLVGCLTALRLRDAGVSSVTVLEKSVPGAEASSAAAGILAAQSESRAPGTLFDLSIASRELYASLADELRARVGMDVGYRRSGVLEVAGGDAELAELERVFGWQRAAGHTVERWTAAQARAHEPGLAGDVAGALAFPGDGQVDPPRLVSAVAQAAERAGVRFRAGAFVRRVVVETGTGAAGGAGARRVTGVELEDGTVLSAGHVVVAAGAWSTLVEGTQLPRGAVRPARGQIVELLTRTPPVNAVVYGRGGYVVPRSDGRVVCGSTLEFVGFRNEVTAGGAARILAMALALVPALEHATFVRAWSNFRPYTPDQVPLVGDAGVEGLTIATGHYRSGILMAPITAALVCERIAGTASGAAGPSLAARFDLAALAPGRAGIDDRSGPTAPDGAHDDDGPSPSRT